MQPTLHLVEDLHVGVQRRIGHGVEAVEGVIGRGDAGASGRLAQGLLHRPHGSRPALPSALTCRAALLRASGPEPVTVVVDGKIGEMASVKDCEGALRRLAASLAEVDPELRARHLPTRRVACRIKDLDVVYVARLDEAGVRGLAPASPVGEIPADTEVKVTVTSDDLMALANGEDDVLQAWLRGRVQISAPMRDMLRLRALVGL
jgi:hypothetical protein